MQSIRTKTSKTLSKICTQTGVAFITLFCGIQSVIADVVPTNGSASTETTISQPTPEQFNIKGGTVSDDGANLFHGFEQFDLDDGDTANFIAQPQIENVISYVTGTPSRIDGTLQLSGSQANLYLINPSGILFGPNALLSLPGHFTAATATSLEFSDQWLHLTGNLASTNPVSAIDYSQLNGSPTAYEFSIDNSVINTGRLQVRNGQSLSLLGGTVVSTGNLSANEGNITITAIEQGNRLRIDQAGGLVSLEIASVPTNSGFEHHSISELLTGHSIEVDTLTVNPDDTVSLSSTDTLIPENKGSAIASGEIVTSGLLGGEINIFGQQVAAINTSVLARGVNGGGTIRFGGSGQNSPVAQVTYIDRSATLKADAFEQGNGGQVSIYADHTARFHGDIQASSGKLSGGGGDVTIIGGRHLIYDGAVEIEAAQGNAGQLRLQTLDIDIENGTRPVESLTPFSNIFALGNANSILYENNIEQFTNLTIQARHGITINPLTNDEVLEFQPGGNILFETDIDNRGGGDFTMRSQDTIHASDSNVTISTGNSATGVEVGNIFTASASASIFQTAGDIKITAQNFLSTHELNAGSADISLKGNGINLLGGDRSITANNVNISPTNPDVGINLGDLPTSDNTLDLTSSDISSLNGQINRLIIGDTNGRGPIMLSDTITSNGRTPLNTSTLIQGNTNNPALVSLSAPNLSTTWTIDGKNSGTLSNFEDLSFSDIANAIGGNADDIFVFTHEQAQIEQLIDGRGGTLTLSGDSIELPQSTKGIGQLLIQPISADRAIYITEEDNTQDALSLTVGELSSVADFLSVEIGSVDSGLLTLQGDITFSRDFTFRSGAEIDAIASNLFGTSENSSLTLIANHDISIGNLITKGGDIEIIGPHGIITGYLNAAGSATDGDITITTDEFFRATAEILGDADGSNMGPSISTGPQGQITITHGGNGRTPFSVGNATQNGTLGTISNQTTTQANTLFYGNFADPSGTVRILTNTDSDIPRSPTEPNLPRMPRPPVIPSQLEETRGETREETSRGSFSDIIAHTSEIEDVEAALEQIETNSSEQFVRQLVTGERPQPTKIATLDQIQQTLSQAKANLSVQPALLYVYFVPDNSYEQAVPTPSPDDQLEIMLVTPHGRPIKHRQWGVTRAQVEAIAADLRYQATSQFSRPRDYLPPAQQLYNWLVSPIQAELARTGTDNLAFVLAEGLRTMPIAAMHDGQSFLVESYSIGLMPSFSLTQLTTELAQARPRSQNHQVLAMGASQFENQPALPAVKAELEAITAQNWATGTFLNEAFTLENLKSQIASDRYDIVHLATHANFESGDLDRSYIQLWDERINLTTLQDLAIDDADIALIILSACNTAMGDRSSEYGFAGFAISAGSESALASLWPVSDEGTLGFMTQFYDQYAASTTRSEALRQAQINMLNGQVKITNGQIKNASDDILAVIPELEGSGNWDFSHPFYWSAFTMIGNPW